MLPLLCGPCDQWCSPKPGLQPPVILLVHAGVFVFCFFLVCIYSKIILPVEKTVLLTCTSDSKPFTTAGSFQQNAFIINPPTRFLLQHVKLSVQLLPFKVTSNINNVNYIIAVDVINLVYFYYLYY